MTELLQHAIRLLQDLPDSDQDAAAGALLDYLGHRDDVRLTDAQVDEVRRRVADPDRVLIPKDLALSRITGFGS